jgi:hypothetical protein
VERLVAQERLCVWLACGPQACEPGEMDPPGVAGSGPDAEAAAGAAPRAKPKAPPARGAQRGSDDEEEEEEGAAARREEEEALAEETEAAAAVRAGGGWGGRGAARDTPRGVACALQRACAAMRAVDRAHGASGLLASTGCGAGGSWRGGLQE